MGPKPALEAIIPTPRAQREWACFEKMESKIEVSLGFAGWS